MPRPEERRVVKASEVFARLQEDMRSLNSSILIITQKMKYLVRNEKILGRNLIVLHRKIKFLEERIGSGQAGFPGSATGSAAIADVLQRLEETNKKALELQIQLQEMQQNIASKDDLQEMRYEIDSINPLQFVTLEQVKSLVKEKGGGKANSAQEKARKKK